MAAPAKPPAASWLFTSFHGNGDGLHLSVSTDGGHQWRDLHKVFLTPSVGSKLLRDPHILRGPDGVYRMVWTTGWKDKGIGYAHSRDLIHWSDQRYLPFMEGVPGTANAWAPETIHDPTTGRYVITWSSDIEGRFPQTRRSGQMNNRTYYVTTKDFRTFTKPRVLIDPGFDHIDTTIQRVGRRYIAVFKEGDNQERGRWGPIQWAVADRVLGPYRLMPKPLVTGERAEGPTLVTDGDRTRLYVDYYANGRYGAFETKDWREWTDVSDTVALVKGQRHGTVLKVPSPLVQTLEAAR
ncbi:glycoside hydrolase family 43 protein [Sphingomonas sp. GM_Shp_1]|uniref:glycoside hydrolase family 43 protein n=1 Tax=Sphingomonas sp. GM_Shp_1 TaxID=2937381 RepID=UPI00226B58B2|nr:glycoside hydrolase family 43 protein [Sphingomonas sp. GM_Shp_1]